MMNNKHVGGFSLAVATLYLASILPNLFPGKVIMTLSIALLGFGVMGAGTEFGDMDGKDSWSDVFIGLGIVMTLILLVLLWNNTISKILVIFSTAGVYGISRGGIGLINRALVIKKNGKPESQMDNEVINLVWRRMFGFVAAFAAFIANLVTIVAYVYR